MLEDQTKEDLEACIISGYRKEHSIEYRAANNNRHSPFIWNTTKTHLIRQTRSDLRSRLSVLRKALRTYLEGGSKMNRHERLHTARIVHRILLKRGLKGNELEDSDLIPLVIADLKELPPCYHELIPTLVPLPLSRDPSRESLPLDYTETAPAPPVAPGPPIGGQEHVSLEVHDSPSASNEGGHSSN